MSTLEQFQKYLDHQIEEKEQELSRARVALEVLESIRSALTTMISNPPKI